MLMQICRRIDIWSVAREGEVDKDKHYGFDISALVTKNKIQSAVCHELCIWVVDAVSCLI